VKYWQPFFLFVNRQNNVDYHKRGAFGVQRLAFNVRRLAFGGPFNVWRSAGVLNVGGWRLAFGGRVLTFNVRGSELLHPG
jgi:hypothetical protein